MAKTSLPIAIQKAIRKLGQDINDSRRRRRISTELMAKRAGIARATLAKIEKGNPSVSMGNYASVIFVLGLTDRLKDLIDANHDVVGRMLEEERLPKRIRLPRSSQENGQDHE